MGRTPSFYAVGSSYLFCQLAGPGRMGGLRVTLFPRSDKEGTIQIALTDWRTGEPHQYSTEGVADMADLASKAIQELASEHSFDISRLDILLDRFVFHDVDSDPKCYVQAARSAFRSALESLQSEDNPFRGRRNW